MIDPCDDDDDRAPMYFCPKKKKSVRETTSLRSQNESPSIHRKQKSRPTAAVPYPRIFPGTTRKTAGKYPGETSVHAYLQIDGTLGLLHVHGDNHPVVLVPEGGPDEPVRVCASFPRFQYLRRRGRAVYPQGINGARVVTLQLFHGVHHPSVR